MEILVEPEAYLRKDCLPQMQIPECPVCWDHFNDSTRMPRMLRCGHTICESCLHYLPLDLTLGQQCLRCPECRSPCLWKGILELPKNYVLLRAFTNSSRANEGFSEVKSYSKTWYFISFLFPLSEYLWADMMWFNRLIRRKFWETAWLAFLAVLLLLLVPLSFVHMLLGFWVAVMGTLILVWFSIGGFGLGIFIFCLWCTYNTIHIFSRLSRSLSRKWNDI